jgi:Na+:H+ antiporter
LIFAELGRTAGVFDAEVYAGIVLVIAYTTLLSPFWIRLYYRRFGDRVRGVPNRDGNQTLD